MGVGDPNFIFFVGVVLALLLLCVGPISDAKKAPYFLSVGSGMKMPNAVREKYHTTDQILSEMEALEARCDVLTRHEVEAIDPQNNLPRKISSYTLTDLRVPKDGKKRFMITFGIHGREYISSETALYMARFVCSKAGTRAPAVSNLQTHVTLDAVPKPERVSLRELSLSLSLCMYACLSLLVHL